MADKPDSDQTRVHDAPGAKTDPTASKGIDFSTVMKDSPKSNPNDERVVLANQISAVYDSVAREENDPKLKDSWGHGEHLRELGNLDLKTGDLLSGRFALELAAQTLHLANDKPKNAENEITDTLKEFATSLTFHNKDANAHLQKSIQIMTDVVTRAEMEKRNPAEVVPLIQQKATTEIDFANLVGHKTPDDIKLYTSTLKAAATDLNDGLNLSAHENNPNQAKLDQARLHAELGFANKEINDVDRNNWYNNVWGAELVGYGKLGTTGEYKQAVDLFNQFKPGNEAQKAQIEAEKLTTIARYVESAEKGDKNIPDMQKQAEKISRQHPDWNLKL